MKFETCPTNSKSSWPSVTASGSRTSSLSALMDCARIGGRNEQEEQREKKSGRAVSMRFMEFSFLLLNVASRAPEVVRKW